MKSITEITICFDLPTEKASKGKRISPAYEQDRWPRPRLLIFNEGNLSSPKYSMRVPFQLYRNILRSKTKALRTIPNGEQTAYKRKLLILSCKQSNSRIKSKFDNYFQIPYKYLNHNHYNYPLGTG